VHGRRTVKPVCTLLTSFASCSPCLSWLVPYPGSRRVIYCCGDMGRGSQGRLNMSCTPGTDGATVEIKARKQSTSKHVERETLQLYNDKVDTVMLSATSDRGLALRREALKRAEDMREHQLIGTSVGLFLLGTSLGEEQQVPRPMPPTVETRRKDPVERLYQPHFLKLHGWTTVARLVPPSS
jgi:hypothetical protein